MIRNIFNSRNLLYVLVLSLVLLLIIPDTADARKGSFGGRRSVGRTFSRSTRTRTMRSPRSTSFGSRRTRSSMSRNRTSFGGNRLNSSRAYTSRYGIPRKVVSGKRVKGVPKNYKIMNYRGYGNGLTMNYLLHRTPLLWHTPFHSAFYYTQPYYVKNSDGTVSVYPPTFSISKVIFTIFLFAAILFVLKRVLSAMRGGAGRRRYSQTQYSSKSSFT